MEKDIRQSLQEHIFRLENRRRELMRPEYLRLGLTTITSVCRFARKQINVAPRAYYIKTRRVKTTCCAISITVGTAHKIQGCITAR